MAKSNTDPMNLPLGSQHPTLRMGAGSATATPKVEAASAAFETATEAGSEPSAPPSSRPSLTKAEIRSMFQDLSSGLGDPTSRASAPESEIAQYAEPHRLRPKNDTPLEEPAIVVRQSVLDGVVPAASPRPAASVAPLRLGSPAARRLVTAETVRTRPLHVTARGRAITATVVAATVTLLVAAGIVVVRGGAAESEKPTLAPASVGPVAPPTSVTLAASAAVSSTAPSAAPAASTPSTATSPPDAPNAHARTRAPDSAAPGANRSQARPLPSAAQDSAPANPYSDFYPQERSR